MNVFFVFHFCCGGIMSIACQCLIKVIGKVVMQRQKACASEDHDPLVACDKEATMPLKQKKIRCGNNESKTTTTRRSQRCVNFSESVEEIHYYETGVSKEEKDQFYYSPSDFLAMRAKAERTAQKKEGQQQELHKLVGLERFTLHGKRIATLHHNMTHYAVFKEQQMQRRRLVSDDDEIARLCLEASSSSVSQAVERAQCWSPSTTITTVSGASSTKSNKSSNKSNKSNKSSNKSSNNNKSKKSKTRRRKQKKTMPPQHTKLNVAVGKRRRFWRQ